MSVNDTYGLNSETKFECFGHVQKRVGSRLRKLKTKTKGLSGKGKLTDNFIDRLQNCYGIAVRSNVGNLTAMQQNVIAALYHCASSDNKPMHGRGCLVIKVKDSSNEFEPCTAEHRPCRGGRSTLNMLGFKRPPIGVVWKLGAEGTSSVSEFDCPRIITSTIARLRTEHLKGMKIHPDKTRSYVQCKHCPDLQLTPNHILECPNVATKLLKMGMVPLRDSLRELLYSPDAPRIAEAVIKTFDGIQ
ncbi:uncharacterized protein TNCV_4778511 [Trichonephila clavipes]|nr:uncharacterized protein TNCV_4778511 [Trichonephila clavipes]